MRFYRVHLTQNHGESAGFQFFTTRRDAEAASRKWHKEDAPGELHPPKIDELDVAPTKAGILAALKQYASHEQNG